LSVRRLLVATDFGLALPVALIQSGDKVLEVEETGRLSDPRNLVFEAVGEAFIIKAGQSHLVPTSTTRVSVEFQRVARSLLGILVPEGLECGHGIVDRITRTKQALELRQEQRIGREPSRELRGLSHGVIEFGLKPFERGAL
jgi:hypothetical protein